MKQIILFALLMPLTTAIHAQLEPAEVTRKFFADPDVVIDVPSFAKNEGYTTHDEMMDYLRRLAAAHSELVTIETAGHTQRGLDIPLVTIRKGRQEGRLRVLFFARVHGNEPSGTDALLWLAHQLATCDSLQYLTEKMEFYLVPMVNGDGAAADDRLSASGVNINRDMVSLATPEAALLNALMTRIEPQVVTDFHEFWPYHSRYSVLDAHKMMIPWDVEFNFTGHPNVPACLRRLMQHPFIYNAGAMLDSQGLTHHSYFSTTQTPDGLIFELGGNSPGISMNAFALRNTVALLIETRGIGLGRTSLRRRVDAAYRVALSIARTAFYNEQTVRQTLAEAAQSKEAVTLKYHPAESKMMLNFIDANINNVRALEVSSLSYMDATPDAKVPLPGAFYLRHDQSDVAERLRKLGITVSVSDKAFSKEVFVFTPNDKDIQKVRRILRFPVGTFVVATAQPCGRLASTLLEPLSSDGWVATGLISKTAGQELPVFVAP